MKKLILAITVMVFMVAFNTKKEVNYALFSGKISNVKNENALILITSEEGEIIKKITLDNKGIFTDTIFNTNAYYNLKYISGATWGNALIYLEDGYNLKINVNAKKFDRSLTYSGIGEKPNNYLAKRFLKEDKEIKDQNTLYALGEESFLKKIMTLKSDLVADLKAVDESFAKKELKNLKYEYAVKLLVYEILHGLLIKDEDFKVSDKFPNPLEGIDLEEEKDYEESYPYRMLIQYNFKISLKKETKETEIPAKELIVRKIKLMKQGKIRNDLLDLFVLDDVLEVGFNANEMNDIVMELATDENLKKETQKVYQQKQALQKGTPSPIFENYENHKGGTTSLKDFRGKFVYIDVWATSCAPCKREIPFMKKIEEKYQGKNIVFVSISVDGKVSKKNWRTMVKNEKMTGIQLIADKELASEFMRKYGVNAIPRFIFIDPEGNIINADAPRPSNPNLIKLFKEYEI